MKELRNISLRQLNIMNFINEDRNQQHELELNQGKNEKGGIAII